VLLLVLVLVVVLVLVIVLERRGNIGMVQLRVTLLTPEQRQAI
jgi:hypothetical protein